MVLFSPRVVAIARLLLGENLVGKLAVVLGGRSVRVVKQNGGVRRGLRELGVLSNDGLKDQLREPLADLVHDVLAAVLPAIVATAQDSRDSNLRVKPLPDHLNVTENLSQAVKVQHGCLDRNNHFSGGIESVDRHEPHVGRAVKEHVREAVRLELPELEFEDLL